MIPARRLRPALLALALAGCVPAPSTEAPVAPAPAAQTDSAACARAER